MYIDILRFCPHMKCGFWYTLLHGKGSDSKTARERQESMVTGRALDGNPQIRSHAGEVALVATLRRVAVLFFAVLGIRAFAATAMTQVSVADNGTYELAIDGEANTANESTVHGSYTYDGVNFILGTNCTIKLTGMAGDGSDFTLNAAAYCVNGGFTIDGSELQGYSDTLRWCGCAYVPNGTVTVKGFKKIVFGNSKKLAESTTATVALNVNDVLSDAAGFEGLVFTNTVTLCRALATCPYVISPGTVFWPNYANALSAEGDAFQPDGWTLGLVNVNCVSNDTIRVPNGYNLPFRPCSVQFAANRMGNWGGGTQNLGYNVDLDGVDSSFVIWNNAAGTIHLNGDFTGSGSVAFYGQSANVIRIILEGRAAYTGKTLIRGNNNSAIGNDTIIFRDPAPASSCLELGKAASATYRFLPLGYATSNTLIRVNAFKGASSTIDTVEVATNQTIRAGFVEGKIAFKGPESGLVVIDSLAANAEVRLVGGVRLQVNVAASGAHVVLGAADDEVPGSWHVSGPSEGTAVSLAVTEVVPGGRIVYGGRWAFAGWQDKVALWTDATAADSLTFIRDLNPDATNVNAKGVLWWRDRRQDQTTYAWAQARFPATSTANINKYPGVYPILRSNGPNGLGYLDFEGNQKRFHSLGVGDALNHPLRDACVKIPSAYAIVVMKGMDSTSYGASVFADVGPDYYSRGGVGKNKPMFTNATISVYRDGTSVASPTTTSFGTSWGIFSFTAEEDIIGLACIDPHESSNTGGFSFGEILIFSEAPTEEERMVVEEYLSEKWDLPVSHSDSLIGKELDFDVPARPEQNTLSLSDDIPYRLTANVKLQDDLADGIYPLVTHAGIKDYELGTVTGGSDAKIVRLVWQEATSTLSLEVISRGTMIIFR